MKCSECCRHCEAVTVDFGIGRYEFWGQRGVHHDYQAVSDCCEATIVDDCEVHAVESRTLAGFADWQETVIAEELATVDRIYLAAEAAGDAEVMAMLPDDVLDKSEELEERLAVSEAA